MRLLTGSHLLITLSGALALAVACSADRTVLDQALCEIEGAVDDDGRVCRNGFWQHLDTLDDDLDTSQDTSPPDAIVVDDCDRCAAAEHCCTTASGALTCVPDDVTNCGGCGQTCGDGQTCAAGACTCAVGRTDCDTDPTTCEVSLLTSAGHCGQCGLTCDGAEICANATCTCGATECAVDKTCCGDDLCVDTSSHAQHCGDCEMVCGAGEVCRDGTCQCGDGAACGVGERCCTAECRPVGEPCPCGGTDCTDTQICCADSCVGNDTRQNCGGCGVSCRDDQSCDGGTCTCSGSTLECDGACVDPTTDAQHCGGCGIACGNGETCCGGQCRDSTNPCSWWDTNWAVRFPLTLETPTDLPVGAPVPVALDHAAMVAAAQSLPDGADLRVVRFTNGTWTPVATTRDPQFAPGANNTVMWFALDTALAASSNDTSYFLYAQNPSPTGGLAAYSALFELAADFDDGQLPANIARDVVNGMFNVTGGRLELDTTVAGFQDGVLFWYGQPMPADRNWHVRFVVRWDELEPDTRLVWLGLDGTFDEPEFISVASGAPNDSQVLLRNWGGTQELNASYYRSTGSVYWTSIEGWDAVGDTGSRNGYTVSTSAWYVAELLSDSDTFSLRVTELATGQLVFETTPVNWSQVQHQNAPQWLVWGERQLQNDGGRMAWDSLLLRRWYGADPVISVGGAQAQP